MAVSVCCLSVHTNPRLIRITMLRAIRRLSRAQLLLLAMLVFMVVYLTNQMFQSRVLDEQHSQPRHVNPVSSNKGHRNVQANYNYETEDLVYYKRETPLIWVGGVPRSGTTLMRAMLDAHPDIRCGEETRVIPRILGMHVNMQRSDKERTRLQEAKITEEVLNDALGAYVLSIIAKHGEHAPRLCNKDPFTLRSMQKILTIFPNSKFVLMVRDGRATVHSIISRHVTIKGFDITSYRGALKDWNRAISTMYEQCLGVGDDVCLPVFYEQLVLHPTSQMHRILRFLDVNWSDQVLHHERMINQTGGVSLSKKELSTDQVNKPINTAALVTWVGHIPSDVKDEMRVLAPMLETLGYDPDSYPPDYGKPDPGVHDAGQAKMNRAGRKH